MTPKTSSSPRLTARPRRSGSAMARNSVRVALRYGSGTLDVDLPAARTTVVLPGRRRPAENPRAAVVEALRRPIAGPPLRDAVRGARKVAISICDGTRAQP